MLLYSVCRYEYFEISYTEAWVITSCISQYAKKHFSMGWKEHQVFQLHVHTLPSGSDIEHSGNCPENKNEE